MKKTGKILFVIFIVFILGVILIIRSTRDRLPDYTLDLHIMNSDPGLLKTGFAAVSVTPVPEDSWIDANNDFQFHPRHGDRWEDKNNNGKFDAFWMAGFQNKRPAQMVHDDLWARAIVIDDGNTRLAMVSVDALGLFHNDVVQIRNLIPEDAGVTYTTVSATHTHQAPDMLGLWGPGYLKTGVNKEYKEKILSATAQAVTQAAQNLRPSRLHFAVNQEDAAHLVTDTRPPTVLDQAVRIMHAMDAEADTTLGILVVWGCHPETTWNRHLEISSDFPHYLRHYLEEGIHETGRVIQKGYGGTAIFVAGAIGGLMTTSPDIHVTDPVTRESYREPSFRKADAQGKILAMIVDSTLKHSGDTITRAGIQLRAKTLKLPVENNFFRLAVILKIVDRGFNGWNRVRSEIAAFSIGNASFLTLPGEIYPEIIHGGIVAPPGRDLDTDPVEVPPLRSLMPGKYHFFMGLTNDEIGYIIPKSEWDKKPPYLYDSENEYYGEINSLGPETAPILHSALKDILSSFHTPVEKDE